MYRFSYCSLSFLTIIFTIHLVNGQGIFYVLVVYAAFIDYAVESLINPSPLYTVPGISDFFLCISTTDLTGAQWLINGTKVANLSPDVNVTQNFVPGVRAGVLTFNNILVEYNNTRVQCNATSKNHGLILSSSTFLILQGEWSIQCVNELVLSISQ